MPTVRAATSVAASIRPSAAPVRLHPGRRSLSREESALEIGAEDAVPQRLVNLERGTHLFHARVVDQDVEPAEARGRFGHRRAASLDRRHIMFDGASFDAARLKLGQCRLERLQRAARDSDGGPRSP
jgi:hypothetical protein